MFRTLCVCTAVLVTVLSTDALARQQGGTFTPPTGGDTTMTKAQHPTTTAGDANPLSPPSLAAIAPTPNAPPTYGNPLPNLMTPTTPDAKPPVANTPKTEKGAHSRDCNPNFPDEGTKIPEPAPATALTSEPKGKDNLSPPPKAPVEALTAVSPTGDEHPNSKTEPAIKSEDPTKSASHQANTQSGGDKSGSSASNVGFVLIGVVAAVAAVGIAASHMKKARDADAALITPEDEHIHIEIRNTPAGGSTIL